MRGCLKKGIAWGIEPFGRVRRAYPQLQLDLTIIGDSNGAPEEEKEKEKILTTIKKHRLNHCVRMMGYQPHSVFFREVERHRIFLSPSVHASNGDSEGGVPVSLIEASASGMPILSTNHCDIPKVIVDGQSGYLAPERDVRALTEDRLGLKLEDLDLIERHCGFSGRRVMRFANLERNSLTGIHGWVFARHEICWALSFGRVREQIP